MLSNNTADTLVQKTLCTNWSLELNCDMAEDTELGDSWKTFVPTLAGFNVTIERFWTDDTEFNNLGTDQAIILYVNTTSGYRYDGLGKMESLSTTDSVSELVTESVGFVGQGQPYYTNLLIKTS